MFTFWSRLFATHLQEEIAYLREQVQHERDRAERAIDELLRVRIQSPGVAAPLPLPEPENIVAKLLADSEWSGAGDAQE